VTKPNVKVIIPAAVTLLALSLLIAPAASARGAASVPATTGSLARGGWILDGQAYDSAHPLSDLLALDPALTRQAFDNPRTLVLSINDSDPIPGGWSTRLGRHYTSYESYPCPDPSWCLSLTDDLAGGGAPPAGTVAMYDAEKWDRTAPAEQALIGSASDDECYWMRQFNTLASQYRMRAMMSPFGNLTLPLRGGETNSWESTIRAGLPGCTAASGAPFFHLGAQGREASETVFVNFLTQASLQARAVNRNIQLSYGLSTNPNYHPTAENLYQAWADASAIEALTARPYKAWLNVIGDGGPNLAIQLLQKVQDKAPVTPRSSVLFLQPGHRLSAGQPPQRPAPPGTSRFWLGNANRSATFTTGPVLSGGDVLPSGASDLQFYTSGTPAQSATINVSLGYCQQACSDRHPLASTTVQVPGGASAAASAHGAFALPGGITLPGTGSYRLYVTVSVVTPGGFSLLYGGDHATNLATPILLPVCQASCRDGEG
jgi:hypothetical protein